MLNVIAVEILLTIASGVFVALYSFNASLTSFPSGATIRLLLFSSVKLCVRQGTPFVSQPKPPTEMTGSKAIHPGSHFMLFTHVGKFEKTDRTKDADKQQFN